MEQTRKIICKVSDQLLAGSQSYTFNALIPSGKQAKISRVSWSWEQTGTTKLANFSPMNPVQNCSFTLRLPSTTHVPDQLSGTFVTKGQFDLHMEREQSGTMEFKDFIIPNTIYGAYFELWVTNVDAAQNLEFAIFIMVDLEFI